MTKIIAISLIVLASAGSSAFANSNLRSYEDVLPGYQQPMQMKNYTEQQHWKKLTPSASVETRGEAAMIRSWNHNSNS